MNAEQFISCVSHQNDDDRYELIDGFVHAMGLESLEHSEAKASIFALLRAALGSGPCRAYVDGRAIKTSDYDCRIPDIVVDCGGKTPGSYYADDPEVIIEVASPSTHHLDISDKRDAYMGLDTVKEYIVIFTGPTAIFHHRKTAKGDLSQTALTGDTFILNSLDLEVSVADIFGGIA